MLALVLTLALALTRARKRIHKKITLNNSETPARNDIFANAPLK